MRDPVCFFCNGKKRPRAAVVAIMATGCRKLGAMLESVCPGLEKVNYLFWRENLCRAGQSFSSASPM
jgi:hypothetical protein